MGKQNKRRTHRNAGSWRPEHDHPDRAHACFPGRTGPSPTVFRDQLEIAAGRAYLATTRLTVEGQPMHFDLVASMYAVVHSEVTGPCADILTAYALTGLKQHPNLLPSLGQQTPSTVAGLVACFRRLIEEGVCGRDDQGGFVSIRQLHAAHR
ncbi:hypothetical protein [Streptomyces mobaraensis]|uniref:Uncharacterized protein n=1 Tax=Streptomyces mobaraensis TaxID=35621 RepID=A0A5N5W1C0_STRMB|nr:hypothetical protein [Streptomyces mobaraensis]KAB7835571.1 hypothetical protein FRZ00_27185 [Streptomyces mobaraensis]